MTDCIRIHARDNVAVALRPLARGTEVRVGERTLRVVQDIEAGHKIALCRLAQGDTVVKYGQPVAHATAYIAPGQCVDHTNVATNLSGLDSYVYQPRLATLPFAPQERTFMGYRRADGCVGIRNEVWVVPTVGCVNGVAQRLADQLRCETGGEGVDAIVAHLHNYGCSQLGDDHEHTRLVLRNLVLHPNAGAVLVVGLGCENNQPDAFRRLLGTEADPQRVRFLVCQQTDDEMGEGMRLLREMYALASADRRTPVPLSELRVGLKCGGSDGLSGITANPLLGQLSDYLVAQGGTTVLTEVPEMFGAERLLMNRCRNEQVFQQLVDMINDFKNYFISQHQPVYENPSPGNKAGGISTLEEKSLGCTQKSGTAPVEAVMRYGERLRCHGLNLLSAPGNDLVASTALAAAGCHMVLFTTGRGTPFGTFVPTVKLSSNTPLFLRKRGWIDFNAGSLVEGESMETLTRRLVDFVVEVAGGRPALNEQNGYRGMAIFKQGVTL